MCMWQKIKEIIQKIREWMGAAVSGRGKNSKDTNSSVEIPKECPSASVPDCPSTKAKNDSIGTPDNQDNVPPIDPPFNTDNGADDVIDNSQHDPSPAKPEPPPPSPDEAEETPPEPSQEDKSPGENILDGSSDSAGGNTETKKPEPEEPRDIPGIRNRGHPRPNSGPRQPPTFRPELICRWLAGSLLWDIVLSANDKTPIKEVQRNDEPLKVVNDECRLSSFRGQLSITLEDGTKCKLSLFDDKPLIFKLRNNWKGDGRKVKGITKGYFIVIAPKEWTRKGDIPVESAGCTDAGFRAHYFFRDSSNPTEDIGGFEGHEVPLTTSGFELKGESVFDDSEDGKLFVGSVPELKVPQNIVWARVGSEGQDRWKGENFKPAEQTLAQVLDGRQGRFFVRVYEEAGMLDSDQFRYLCDLKEILVNDDQYTQDTILAPSSTSHPPTTVRFIGVDGATIHPSLPSEVTRAELEAGNLTVDTHPDGDDVSLALKSETGCVDIVLHLPRIWWRIEGDADEPGEWRDTPLTMTRQEFREHADKNATIKLRLPRRLKSVRVGFDDELERTYQSEKGENNSWASLHLRLTDFVDYTQIDQRLKENASLNVECGDAKVSLILISADPVPKIVSFTHEPALVNAGGQVTLCWKTSGTEVDAITIDPEIGTVEANGSVVVAPSETTIYTLRLTASGLDDVTQIVTVVVDRPPQPVEKPIAHVKGVGGGWRRGKGFSYREIRAAGFTTADAKRQSIPIDKRRKSKHPNNIETIRSLLNA
ncbi:MAG: hypothetical protein M2R45_03768 [Verrucomicrobia subdivision 3 bacterium]|nr:hypothetical protein [Limisphaerales bacterium]MCS1416908.1 hypothetical protein [Limisphaerales bacterium]